ncbi:MAG TPA: phosphatase PAP2 family protein [Amycolatopsis sp.]|nr:phosphatase PAP2 family protein [Amycolatopsis sp.]
MVRSALPSSVRAPLAMLSLALLVVAVGLALLLGGNSRPSAFDAWALRVTKWSVPNPADPYTAAWVIGTAGDPPVAAVLVLILVVVCWRMGRKRLAALAIVGPVATGVITTVLKPLIDRTINGDHLSYPSGHTAFLTAMGIVVGLLLVDRFQPARAPAVAVVLGCAVVAGAAMAWSQTASIVHYATDTIGGFCSAFVLVIPIAWLIDRVASRKERDEPQAV